MLTLTPGGGKVTVYFLCKPDDLSSDPQGPHKRPDTCAAGAQTSWLLEGSLKNQDGYFVTVSIRIVSCP